MNTTAEDIRDLLEARLTELIGTLGTIAIPLSQPFGALNYLQRLLTTGHLAGLTAAFPDTIPGNRRMAYDMEAPATIQFDLRLREAFAAAGSEGMALEPAIDSFLIHEFLHFAQHMGFGRHSGLARQSPGLLLQIDYQADALAAAIQTQLALIAAPYGDAWTIHQASLHAVIDQMDVFTRLMSRTFDRARVARMPFGYEKLQRVAVWQFQYHRAMQFERTRSLADMQVLAQPLLHFRGLSSAEPKIYRDWPMRERANGPTDPSIPHDPSLIVSATTPFGTTGFVRCPLEDADYEALFEALFTGDLDLSAAVFEAIFAEHPWLVGGDGGEEDRRGWNGPGGPSPYTFGEEASEMEAEFVVARAREAFTPTILPLTTFGVPVEV